MSHETPAPATPGDLRDDLPVRHFSFKHRVVAWISSYLFDNLTYTVRHGLLRGMTRKGGLGWLPSAISVGVETAEHRFWASLDLGGKVVYDVGAFHGMLTLFFAARARQVIAYEPNSLNRARLLQNLALNGLKNVTVRPLGVGSSTQTLMMVSNGLTPGAASVMPSVIERARLVPGALAEQISMTTLDGDMDQQHMPVPDFIKIDIEGWELEALLGARRTLLEFHPDLFIEMHGETLNEKRRKAAEIVKHLASLGYGRVLHVESGASVTPENSAIAAVGHLYCRS